MGSDRDRSNNDRIKVIEKVKLSIVTLNTITTTTILTTPPGYYIYNLSNWVLTKTEESSSFEFTNSDLWSPTAS